MKYKNNPLEKIDQKFLNHTKQIAESIVGTEVKFLGSGANGIVFKFNKNAGNYIIKILDFSILEECIERFKKLSDLKLIPKVVKIDSHYIILKYLPGKTLKEVQEKLSDNQKLNVYLQLKKIIEKWHSLGFSHGDIELSNILITDNFKVLLFDPSCSGDAFNDDIKQLGKIKRILKIEVRKNPNSNKFAENIVRVPVKFLGEGGNSFVYKFVKNNSFYIIKIFKKHFKLTYDCMKYFMNLSHNKLIPKIIDITSDYMIYKYLPGKTLDEIVNKLSREEKLQIYLQLEKIIKKWHSLGFAHADLEMSNIIITHQKNVVLFDPGCAIEVTFQNAVNDDLSYLREYKKMWELNELIKNPSHNWGKYIISTKNLKYIPFSSIFYTAHDLKKIHKSSGQKKLLENYFIRMMNKFGLYKIYSRQQLLEQISDFYVKNFHHPIKKKLYNFIESIPRGIKIKIV